jgi:primary-amine oxidase
LHKQEELNLTAASDAGAWDNQITVVDAIHPKKADAKAYLASKAGKPDRYAKATIMHGASVHPWIENIIVGPLPISNETTWKEDPYTTRSSPKMPMRAADDDLVYELIYEIFAGVQDIVFDLTGQILNGSDADTAEAWGIDPLW